jgi:hypothetical protein
VLVCATPRHRTDSEQAAAFLAARHRGLSAHIAGSIVLLLPGSDAGAMAREVSVTLGRSLGGPVTAAGQAAGSIRQSLVTDPVADGRPREGQPNEAAAPRLPAAYATARDCLSAMLALGRAGQGAAMTDLGFVGVVLTGGRSGADFVTDTLGPVLDYDAARGTDLAATLDAYFGTGAHLARTAERLHVHPNTVGQRLSRVGTLLGADWVGPERTLQIQLALQLRAVLHAR